MSSFFLVVSRLVKSDVPSWFQWPPNIDMTLAAGRLNGQVHTFLEIEMTTKNVLTVIGVLLGLQGVGLFGGAEAITTQAFAVWQPDATGIKIGAMLHQAMGVVCLMVAVILFSARNLNPLDGARILMAAAIGLAITTGHGFYNMFTTEVEPPLPLLLLMTVLTVVAVVTAMKAKDGSAEEA